MGKPIAGRNKSPFGVAGINVDAAVLSDGTKLTNVRISKQRSVNVFDLLSADGSTLYPFVKITGVDADGVNLDPAEDAAALADVLAPGSFCISIVDADENVLGFAVRLLLNKVVLQDGSVVFLTDYSGQGEIVPEVVDVTGVTVMPTSVALDIGDTQQLVPTVVPNDATDPSVTYSSASDAIATVSSTGLITAVAEGTVNITVTTVDGSFTAVCEVTVNPAP